MTTYADREGALSTRRPATDRQVGYIISLIDTREAPEAGYPWGSDFEGYRAEHGLDMPTASRLIDYLKGRPVKASAPKAPVQLTAGVYRASATGEGQPGQLYKVYPARGHGNMLAKLIVVEDGAVYFEYAGAARRFVQPDGKLSLEEAKAFGASTGYCCNCGAELTDPDSIAAGIGPICAGKF